MSSKSPKKATEIQSNKTTADSSSPTKSADTKKDTTKPQKDNTSNNKQSSSSTSTNNNNNNKNKNNNNNNTTTKKKHGKTLPLTILFSLVVALVAIFYQMHLKSVNRNKYGFSAWTTHLQVVEKLEPMLDSQYVVITGANSALALQTARALAHKGASFVLVARTNEKVQKAESKLRRLLKKDVEAHRIPNALLEQLVVKTFALDLTNFHAIRTFVRDLRALKLKIRVLMLHAGVMFKKNKTMTSPHAIEEHLMVNYLANHYLVQRFLATHSPKLWLRILVLTSSAYQFATPTFLQSGRFEDALSEIGESLTSYDHSNNGVAEYKPHRVYANSRLASLLFTMELHRRYYSKKVIAVSVYPGTMWQTKVGHESYWFPQLHSFGVPFLFKSVEQAAATSVYCSIYPFLNVFGGWYFQDAHESNATFAQHLLDSESITKQFWDDTQVYIRQKYTESSSSQQQQQHKTDEVDEETKVGQEQTLKAEHVDHHHDHDHHHHDHDHHDHDHHHHHH